MRHFLIAAGLLASCTALTAPAQALTWQGLSQTVYNDEGEAEHYVVTFTIDDTAPYIYTNYATNPQPGYEIEYYDWAYYPNIVSFSISGPRFDITVDGTNAYTRVSTLRYERVYGGITGFSAHAGSDGFSEGYTFDFNYWLQAGFASTDIPATLDISDAFEAGFSLSAVTPIEESEEFDTREVLNFRFASGGFLTPATPAVPEPATWAMMIGGLGLVGASLRRRAAKVSFA